MTEDKSRPTSSGVEEESLWACFSCGRAQRMTHRWNAPESEVCALARHQHNSRQRGRGCVFKSENVRITRHVEGTKLVGFEVFGETGK